MNAATNLTQSQDALAGWGRTEQDAVAEPSWLLSSVTAAAAALVPRERGLLTWGAVRKELVDGLGPDEGLAALVRRARRRVLASEHGALGLDLTVETDQDVENCRRCGVVVVRYDRRGA